MLAAAAKRSFLDGHPIAWYPRFLSRTPSTPQFKGIEVIGGQAWQTTAPLKRSSSLESRSQLHKYLRSFY